MVRRNVLHPIERLVSPVCRKRSSGKFSTFASRTACVLPQFRFVPASCRAGGIRRVQHAAGSAAPDVAPTHQADARPGNGIHVTRRVITWPRVENAAYAAGKDLVQVLERRRRVAKSVCRVLGKPPARCENRRAERRLRLRWRRSRRLPTRWQIIAARLGACRPEKAVRGLLVPENPDKLRVDAEAILVQL